MVEEKNTYVFQFDSGEVRVKSETDSSHIDLNGADEKVLGSMFQSMGVDGATQSALIDSILDWRDADDVARPNGAEIDNYGGSFVSGKRLPANAPFSSMQEVMLVKNMTPDIYFGRISFDPRANKHEKVVGLRDVATVGSGATLIDVNTAPVEVLAALPGISRDMAANIVTEREKKPFADLNECFGRLPDLASSAAHDYLTTVAGLPNLLVSTATVQPSGTSKTVRLRLRSERVKKIITFDPLVYVDTPVVKFGGWEY
jgi:general secretion pathway protein K